MQAGRGIYYPIEVFSFKKQKDTQQPSAVQATVASSQDRTKKQPTPKRRHQEAKNLHPLVPADRKEAKRQDRERRNIAFQREQEALITGDERYLPARDKGKARRYIRDWVDARWSLSEFVVPAMLLFILMMLVFSFMRSNATTTMRILNILTLIFYGLFLLSIGEGVVVWQRLKRRFKRVYPNQSIPKGSWFYCYSRMVMARRWRSPKPQVERGEFPKNQPHP